ncbi:Antirestriction protein [Gordonia malaquae]|uniref:Antirestriction ArdA family protein n=1 Tax=Gordonia malaquae NBRC 108250 TaxID=1223542 RepID=M3VBT5_GORML|nr:antirestriction protein ArdA [Gordonia malaquae]GAC80823.1 hypothetical protein GM1_022_00330 [Gordonia malaquae NBRC 108250]SEB68482.1 Antirestriction protein [Gordonia malaquae]
MTTTVIAEPQVWAGCLNCYNSGRLVGHWFGVTEAADVDLAAVHRGSGVNTAAEGCEELWCLDIDGLPVRREMGLLEAAEWGEVFTEAGESWPAVAAWVRTGDYIAEGDTDLPVLSDFTDRYCGHWDSFRDYAFGLADDIGLLRDVPEEIERYFHWDAWIRDLKMDHSTAEAPDGGVYIFRSL